MSDDQQESSNKIKTSEDAKKSEDSSGGGMDLDSLHLDDLQRQWIKTMHLAGQNDDQIKTMFDEHGRISKNINGWIMCIDGNKDMKENEDINLTLKNIADIKPLLICIDSSSHSKELEDKISNKQSQMGRYFWIKKYQNIKTNLTRDKMHTEDPEGKRINLLINALYKSGRISSNSVGSIWPEEQIKFWHDLSGLALDPIKVQKARKEEMSEFAKHQVYVKRPIK